MVVVATLVAAVEIVSLVAAAAALAPAVVAHRPELRVHCCLPSDRSQ